MKSTTIAAAILLLSSALHAQLEPPNAMGVSMGHLHLNTGDVHAQQKLWIEILGAKAIKLGTIDGVSMPGAVVLFTAKVPTGGTDGSTVNHVGVTVPSLARFPAKLDAASFSYTQDTKKKQLTLVGPDGLKVELTEVEAQAEPIRFHHIHFYIPDPKAIQAWYAEKFGATPGKRAIWDAGDLPGVNLTFAKAPGAVAPTVGRALDHIGFEVHDLEAFCKKLEASGVKLDVPYRKVPQLGLSLAFLTDPWGTRIELTEGLGKVAGN